MKPNIFLCIMAVLLSFFIGYFVYYLAEGKPNDTICGVVSTVALVVTFLPILGIKHESDRIGVNLKVLSTLAFILLLIVNIIFACTVIRMPLYIIINGIILVVYASVFYKLSRLKDL